MLNHAGNVDVIVDVAGYYKAGTGKLFHPLTPARILDSRPGAGNTGGFTTPWGPNVTRDVVGRRRRRAPYADSVVLNVTVAGADGASFLALYPKGGSPPTVSNLNSHRGRGHPQRGHGEVGHERQHGVGQPRRARRRDRRRRRLLR